MRLEVGDMELVRDEQKRLTAVDVAQLSTVEVYGSLVLLAGHRDPVVAAAVVDAVQDILQRTRGTDDNP